INFVVRALNCSGSPAACENLLFLANFDLERPVTPDDYLIINKFNDSQLFGRAYVLANTSQVGVEYVLEMGGGVSSEHIAQNVGRWANIIGAFLGNFSNGTS
ncbi:MAG: YbjN domain-containing protein, partial [Parvularculaceae bacterium]